MKDSGWAREFRLDGRVALVTGGGSGLGLRFALALGAAGAKVVVSGRRREALEQAVHLLADQGSEGIPLELDVADEASIKRGLLDDRLPGPVEILVNNAGLSRPGPALQLPTVDWDAVFATNLRGGFLLARAVAEALIDAGKPGNIINVCSVLGRSPQKGVMPYAASKAGLLHVTRLLALEWARYGIRVNALVPGFFRTSITASYLDSAAGRSLVQRIPQRRAGAIDELAWPLLLLASDASAYMTGAELVVDGGLSVNPL